MKLIECFIENFGKIQQQRFEFTDGLNTILANNGYGKTTLSVFIKCMLYGMSDSKKMSLDENERKRYLPWSGAVCSGSLTFTTGNKTYRVERIFAPKAAEDRFSLYDVELGRECRDYSENLGEEIFGVDAESFERTLFLSERNLSPKNDNKTISSKLSELVGCDGDISSMDGALKLLEEQRKSYAKKGGSGEIADTRLEISKITEEIAEIDRCDERMDDTEKRLAALVERERELRDEDSGIIREREVLAKRAGEQNYKNALIDMQTRLSVCEARRNQLLDFFCGEIPTTSSIDRAKFAQAEISRLKKLVTVEEDLEYTSLKNFFNNRVTPDKMSRIKELYERVIWSKNKTNPTAERKAALFVKRTPTLAEINSQIALQNESSTSPALLVIIAAAITVLGAVLGIFVSPFLYVLSLLGIGAIAAIPMLKKNKENSKKSAATAFFKSISDQLLFDGRAATDILEEMRNLLTADDDDITDTNSDLSELSHFTFLFGMSDEPLSDTKIILDKYERFKELLAIEKYKLQNRESAEKELMEREAELAKFLAGFKHTTSDPVEEIRTALSEYVRISDDIVAKRRDITNLSTSHKTSEDSSERIRSASELDKRAAELSFLFSDISRERALLERQYRADAERIESREELVSKKEELEERLEKYTENLEIIKLTKKFLEISRDNMTVKYLGKTKAGFESYSKKISGDEGNFDMDTDFAISKTEGAKTHTTEAYSRGMRDLYNIALRFALVDSLFENEKPFVILDDPFTAFDDDKCEAALELINEFAKTKQIIYFTCSKSRA